MESKPRLVRIRLPSSLCKPSCTPYFDWEDIWNDDYSKRPIICDLFCGGGGAALGLYLAGFRVVGVDLKFQPHYPFEFIQADAMTFPLEGYDAYWASPPCQGYVDRNKNRETKHPRLIEPIRQRLLNTGKLYIIENVVGAPYLKANIMLCGTMFNLRVFRHRYFELSFPAPLSPFSCNHWGQCQTGQFIGVYAFGPHGKRDINGFRGKPLRSQVTKAEAMGIDWMTDKEINEAIPPAYSEYLGKFLLTAVRENKRD